MTTIYIASPYTKGDQALNVRRSLEVADELRSAGFLPFAPLLSHFWHCIFPHSYEYWMQMDLEWLEKCDGLLRLPGESAGADKEVEFALSLGIPVFFNVSDVVEWYKEWRVSIGECVCEQCKNAMPHNWFDKNCFDKEVDLS